MSNHTNTQLSEASEREPYWEYDANGNSPKPALRECPLCPNGGQPYFTRTVNGTNMIYVGCSQCGLGLKAALIMVTPTKEQPSKDIVAIWNSRAAVAAPQGDSRCDVSVTGQHRLVETYCKDCGQVFPPTPISRSLKVEEVAVGEQDEDETFTAKHFAFGPCIHSMVKRDCPSCCQSHAVRLEMQLGKLEHSMALPIRERIERALREHMRHCFAVYKGVPPTVDDWVGGAVHYVMWGLDRDVPLAAAATPITPSDAARKAAADPEREQFLLSDITPVVVEEGDEDVKCTNRFCMDGWVDEAGSSPDGTENWVKQVPCEVCRIHCDDD